MSVAKICSSVISSVKLSPALGNKLIGNTNAVELAGIIRLTARKAGLSDISQSGAMKSGKNFIKWFNNKFLNPKLGKGMTSDGKFTEKLRLSLNKTGYTLKDFAEYVKDMMVVGKFVDTSHTTGKGLKKIAKKHGIFSPEAIKNFLENIQQKGGLGKNLVGEVCKKTGLTLSKLIGYCQKTININKAVVEGLKP